MTTRTTRKAPPKATAAKMAIARREAKDDGTPLGIMARLARDPQLTVEKFAQLVGINREMMAATAASEYWAAYDRMVEEIPTISKRGKILNKEGKVQSHYAKFEDIQRIVKPILKRFGFVLSYRTTWPDGIGPVAEVVARLTHVGGHYEESRFRSPADASGGKNAIQGLGSANSYGKRYTVKDLLNIVEEGVDDDGQKARHAEPKRGDVVEHGAPPVDFHHNDSKEPITEGQLKRLKVIIRNSGRIDRDVKVWIGQAFKLKKLTEIRRCDYDRIVSTIEGPGELPKVAAREPGAEG